MLLSRESKGSWMIFSLDLQVLPFEEETDKVYAIIGNGSSLDMIVTFER